MGLILLRGGGSVGGGGGRFTIRFACIDTAGHTQGHGVIMKSSLTIE